MCLQHCLKVVKRFFYDYFKDPLDVSSVFILGVSKDVSKGISRVFQRCIWCFNGASRDF